MSEPGVSHSPIARSLLQHKTRDRECLSDDPEPNLIRSKIMWDYLQVAHTLLDSYLTIPLETFPSLAFISMLNFALGIVNGGALLCLDNHDLGEISTCHTPFNASANCSRKQPDLVIHDVVLC
ncbi:hypothetical protein N7537_000877 [Penicillium hordei]|uniref:Uncharacterized protein n=1 Tax=Penicillium hordei TaxID=40994 RepID=A0AAD6H6G5_9EURO|nr:uncharacterized protein N7537_000877 [Penicillium hordei]KAJ5615763.1 hypothetical protein N7537_000877 [Penicillium hordei]